MILNTCLYTNLHTYLYQDDSNVKIMPTNEMFDDFIYYYRSVFKNDQIMNNIVNEFKTLENVFMLISIEEEKLKISSLNQNKNMGVLTDIFTDEEIEKANKDNHIIILGGIFNEDTDQIFILRKLIYDHHKILSA